MGREEGLEGKKKLTNQTTPDPSYSGGEKDTKQAIVPRETEVKETLVNKGNSEDRQTKKQYDERRKREAIGVLERYC